MQKAFCNYVLYLEDLNESGEAPASCHVGETLPSTCPDDINP